jgi:cell division transport system permease protein
MGKQEQRYYRRRVAASQATSVISITLVLFLMGLLGLLILHAAILSDYVKENIGFSIMIKEEVREAGILEIKKQLDAKEYVKSSEYIPREQAAEKLKAELGEDFVGFLGYNPLLPSIELRIRAPWANPDSLARIEKQLLLNPGIREVFYHKSLVEAINRNVRKISLVILTFSAILLFIAIVLINNTIRLSVYARRFTIRTMQLVGATEAFIRRPMLLRGVWQGILSAFFALLLLMILVSLALDQIPELAGLQDPVMLAALALIILVLGVFISWFSTFFAVTKYLRIRTDLLYG